MPGSGDLFSMFGDLSRTKTDVANRFGTYTPEFSFSDMSNVLDKSTESQKNQGMKALGGMLDKNKRSARASLASSGISGGSIMNDLMAEAENKVGSQTSDFLSNLSTSRMNANIPLMQDANSSKFAATQAATNVDLANSNSNMQKQSLMAKILQAANEMKMQEDNQPGFWDDLFAGINAGAGLLKGAGGIGEIAKLF